MYKKRDVQYRKGKKKYKGKVSQVRVSELVCLYKRGKIKGLILGSVTNEGEGQKRWNNKNFG